MLNTPCDVQVYNCLIGIESSILTLLFHISGVVNHLSRERSQILVIEEEICV
jgi:hypothetical protein